MGNLVIKARPRNLCGFLFILWHLLTGAVIADQDVRIGPQAGTIGPHDSSIMIGSRTSGRETGRQKSRPANAEARAAASASRGIQQPTTKQSRPQTDRDMKTTSLLVQLRPEAQPRASTATRPGSDNARKSGARTIGQPTGPAQAPGTALPFVPSSPDQLADGAGMSPGASRPPARQATNSAPINGPTAAQSAAAPNLILPTASQNAVRRGAPTALILSVAPGIPLRPSSFTIPDPSQLADVTLSVRVPAPVVPRSPSIPRQRGANFTIPDSGENAEPVADPASSAVGTRSHVTRQR